VLEWFRGYLVIICVKMASSVAVKVWRYNGCVDSGLVIGARMASLVSG